MFRGREVTHPERGRMILDRLAEELQELAIVEQRPNLDGRNMTMMLGPSKAVLAGTLDSGAAAESTEGEAPAEAEATTATPDTEAAAPAENGDAAPVESDDADDAAPVETDDVAPAETEDDAPEATPAADGETPAAS
jgi:translation initiation factor IF-3